MLFSFLPANIRYFEAKNQSFAYLIISHKSRLISKENVAVFINLMQLEKNIEIK